MKKQNVKENWVISMKGTKDLSKQQILNFEFNNS